MNFQPRSDFVFRLKQRYPMHAAGIGNSQLPDEHAPVSPPSAVHGVQGLKLTTEHLNLRSCSEALSQLCLWQPGLIVSVQSSATQHSEQVLLPQSISPGGQTQPGPAAPAQVWPPIQSSGQHAEVLAHAPPQSRWFDSHSRQAPSFVQGQT